MTQPDQSTSTSPTVAHTLAEQLIVAAASAWAEDQETLASGIGLIPRLAASLAMVRNPDLLMTDSEAFVVSEPIPVGPRGSYQPRYETWMGFSRVFETLWSGARHAMVGPTQIDRFGQANISCIGSYEKPKVQMLGVRGFPGNSISHANSFFVPNHNPRVFVDGEVDMVASIGFNPDRLPRGWSYDDIDLRLVVTNLCVMDFTGPSHQLSVRSLHPGVTSAQVQDQTGFPLHMPDHIPDTPLPSRQDLETLAQLDPHNLRARALG